MFQTQAVAFAGEGAERIGGDVVRGGVQAVLVEQLDDAAGDGGRRIDDFDAATRDDAFQHGKQEGIVRASQHDLVGAVFQHHRDGVADGLLGFGRRFAVALDQFDETAAGGGDEFDAAAVFGRRAAEKFAVETPLGLF